MSGKCILRLLPPLQLQNATLGRQNAEFLDNCCEQAESLVDCRRFPYTGGPDPNGVFATLVGVATRSQQERLAVCQDST